MDLNSARTRLETALRRREELSLKHQRALGRLEEAEKALADVRKECQSRNVDPDTIDATIALLEEKFEKLLLDYETQLNAAEAALDSLNRK